MGIYETYTKDPAVTDEATGLQTWTEHQHWPGYIRSRTVTATPWVETSRDDCFCCSCGEREGSDPACRNHGWAAQRPCETHNLPGQPWDNDPETGAMGGGMPLSVQAERARRDAA